MRDRKLPLKEAQGYVKKYDTDQIGFIRKYFNEDINDPKHYDIMVNMQNVGIETAAESIKKAFLAWKAVNEIHQG
jgi:cytidylate kinase